MQSWPYAGHDLLLGLSGTGVLRIRDRTFRINPGELLWVNYNLNHQHVSWPSRSEPWALLCIRVDSDQINLMEEALDVARDPIFRLRNFKQGVKIYKGIFKLMRDRPPVLDAALHSAMAQLFLLLFAARQSTAVEHASSMGNDGMSKPIAKAIKIMRAEYNRKWQAKDLAELVNCSVPQFYRLFNRATGSTPMDWLRRERVNQAKRCLVETHDRICDIAWKTGYDDSHYFSRDFRKYVGVSPRRYREREQVLITTE
jgi:AraC-like DNA-binding protein